MGSEIGDILTVWTARVAMGCYILRYFADVIAIRQPAAARASRVLWTAGCAVFLVHVACAFHFVHGWSHVAAYEHTARETADMIGMNWGGGLYFNYLFAAILVVDVVVWWMAAARGTQRSRAALWCVQAFMAFMVINATVVFGPPFWKPLAAIAVVLWLICFWALRAPVSRNIE